MAEKSEKKQTNNPEDRFRYIGFEVYPKKVKDLFKTEAERDQLVEKVKAKREKGEQLREQCTLTVERVAGYEKIVMTITSLVLILALFLPWFSGYTEVEVTKIVETPAAEESAGIVPPDEEAVMPAESESIVEGAEEQAAGTAGEGEAESGLREALDDELPPVEPQVVGEKDEAGFASITSQQKRIEIEREHYSMSAIGVITSLGDVGGKVFSSGAFVVITAILMIIYMLLCIIMAVYTLYVLYGSKGDADQKALAIKKAVRYNWIGPAIFVLMLLFSFAGGAYSFDTTDMIVQLGGSYGPGTLLGLLSFGFYIAMAAFIMNAVKGSEI